MAYDTTQGQDVNDIFDRIDKEIRQNLKHAITDKETAKKIPTLSSELMISHFKTSNTFWKAIEMLASKQGDNVKILKNQNTNNPIAVVIQTQTIMIVKGITINITCQL